MWSNLLSLINQEGSLGFGEACLYALIGYLIVFVGIAIIILIIWIIGFVLRKTDNLAFLTNIGKKKKKTANKQNATQQVASVNPEEISDEIRVAIIAAIMTYYSEEKPECEFRVRRIKRI